MQATHHHHQSFEVLSGIVLYILRFNINTLLCYTVVGLSVLVLGIGIDRGQYYWILGALFGIVLTLHASKTWIYSALHYKTSNALVTLNRTVLRNWLKLSDSEQHYKMNEEL